MPLNSAELMKDPIGFYPQPTVACFAPPYPWRTAMPTTGQLDEARTLTFLERLATAGEDRRRGRKRINQESKR